MPSFDYIIIGAGSAGCVLAGRLAQARAGRILLLEAGPKDHHPWIHLPMAYGKLFYHPKLNWRYYTEPEAQLNARRIYQPRGKVLGGSSAINAMVYIRGAKQDFEHWQAQGNPGWGWDDVLPYFRKIEDHTLGASALHGAGGPLHISHIQQAVHPLSHQFIQAGQQAGLAFNPDLSHASEAGVGYYQINTQHGLRHSAAQAYLPLASDPTQLQLECHALVQRILFEENHAVAVEYLQAGQLHQVRAAKEILLCGGAINSPQLLQLSGVGPAALLQQHGLPVVRDAPAVGQHLQDHLCYDHVYHSRQASLNDELRPLSGKIRVALRYLFGRKGPLALSINQAGGFFKTRPELAQPDIQLYFSPLTYTQATPGVRALMRPDPFSGFCTSVSPCRPSSRGQVHIRSTDIHTPPRIQPHYLSTEEDQQTLIAGAKFLRQLSHTPALQALVQQELQPGLDCHNDEQWLADIRERAYSVFHPCGSCRMGPDPVQSVVDAQLKVHGLTGLRVVDASIFPSIPSNNINAPSMMVAEKGADLILAGA